MGRPLRATTGGLVYHVLNWGKARMLLCDTPADYLAVERVLAEAQEMMISSGAFPRIETVHSPTIPQLLQIGGAQPSLSRRRHHGLNPLR